MKRKVDTRHTQNVVAVFRAPSLVSQINTNLHGQSRCIRVECMNDVIAHNNFTPVFRRRVFHELLLPHKKSLLRNS